MTTVMKDHVCRLFGKIQHYSWGGDNFIPQLIGQRPEPGMRYAEYWMGAHEKAPSDILQNDGTVMHVDTFIKEHPEQTLGSDVARHYGRLPFLLKILDVREMLSIQVHPTKDEAEQGFARENEMGIALDAPERNYKDDNHKPELQVALGDFWLLHGFRPADQLHKIFHHVPEFSTLLPLFASGGHFGLYKHIMQMPSQQVRTLLDPLAERLLKKYECGALEKSSPDFWAAKAIKNTQSGEYDRGIFSIYFFNLIQLRQGQAIFQDAGIPHAALSGQAIEIMANSDNVIRGGLTPKHVDIPQLLQLVSFKGLTPDILESKPGAKPYEFLYEAACPDFCLHSIQLARENVYEHTAYSAEIVLNLDGTTLLEHAGAEMLLKRGESVMVFAGQSYRLRGRSTEAFLFKASLPQSSRYAG
jgi:mannose-6-phosphate isomerase